MPRHRSTALRRRGLCHRLLLNDLVSLTVSGNVDVRASTPSATPRQFRYTSLQAGSIRLLQIISASDHGIVCEMQPFEMHDPPPYKALSQHLSDAIRAIATFIARWKLHGLSIWIDALCIDQSDLEEKAAQIPIMGQIFGTAHTVFIWFGKLYGSDLTSFQVFEWIDLSRKLNASVDNVTEGRDEILKRMICLEQLLAESGINQLNLIAFMETMRVVNDYAGTDEAKERLNEIRESDLGSHLWPADDEIWFSLLEFLHHPWFSRIWTIQEVRLANRAVLLGEDSHISWSTLQWCRCNVFRSSCRETLYSSKIFSWTRLVTRPRVEFDMHKLSENRDSRLDAAFPKLLAGIRLHKTKEAKDYIYGILVTQQEAYSEAVIAACTLEDGAAFWSLLMAMYADTTSELAGLPSWVPDFSSRSYKAHSALGIGMSKLVRDKYAHLAYLTFPEGSSVAAVRGKCLDKIESVIVPRTIDLQGSLGFDKLLDDADQLTRLRSVFDMNEDLFCTLFGSEQHAWLCEMESIFPPNGASSVDCNSELLSAWMGSTLFDVDVEEVSRRYHDVRAFVELVQAHACRTFAEAAAHTNTHLDERASEELMIGILHILLPTGQRNIFRTTAGRLGFGPKPATPGDHICTIPGGKLLHVLSADKRKYVTAYPHVEGFMGDDLLDALPLDPDEWEIFHLR